MNTIYINKGIVNIQIDPGLTNRSNYARIMYKINELLVQHVERLDEAVIIHFEVRNDPKQWFVWRYKYNSKSAHNG